MSNLKKALEDAEAIASLLRQALDIYNQMGEDILAPKPANKLSKRESEIYELLRQQKDLDEISTLLKLSRKTVDVHRENIKKKLGFKSAKDLYRSIRNERLS